MELRKQPYPIARLHGYEVTRPALKRTARTLARLDVAARAAIPGLNSGRADSIAAGAIAIDEVMEYVGASHLHVSGQGMREGVIRGTVPDALPAPDVVRAASVRALCREFYRWDRPHAERRAGLAVALFDALRPEGDALLREALAHAAQVIDVGATIDVYNRHARAADVVLESDLQGFSHRGLVAVAALLLLAERPAANLRAYRPVLDALPGEELSAAAALLDLADQVERRSPPGSGEPSVTVRKRTLEVRAPVSPWWRGEECSARVEETFDRELVLIPTGQDPPVT